GKLHPAAALAFSDTKLLQQTHLRRLVAKILPLVMPEYMKTSAAVTTLVKEIVACAVLTPIVLMLSDPDFFNQLIENSGRTMLQDRKSVRKLRAALDEHAVPTPQHPKAAQFPRLRPNDNERQFERFIRATRNCATLSDARRFRSEISSQVRKATSGPDQDPVYLRRLESGRRILDQKIAHFTAGGSSRPKLTVKASTSSIDHTSRLSQASLDEVLHNASGLSYFMEFMDRKSRMRLVQFWIVVDGFRNPLEGDNDEPEQELQDTPWTPSDRMDLEQMYEAYLTKPELNVPDHDRRAVRDFLRAGRSADARLYVSARRAVLRAQTAVFEEMKEQHFENFRKSDLFYKWLATEESSIMSATSDGHQELSRSLSVGGERDRPLHREARPATVLSPKSPRAAELKRPALSSTDLKSFIKPSVVASPVRQSMDGGRPRPLFDDDVEDERMTRSVSALSSMDLDVDGDQPHDDSAQVVDAMQAALNEIMDEPDNGSIFSSESLSVSNDSPRTSLDGARPSLVQTRSKPSIASLGLVGAVSSKGVFEDDLFGEEEKFAEDEKEDSDLGEKSIEDDIHEAAPGDLGLTEAISTLNADIDRLTAQDAILDSLTKKAELTNNAAELRILRKSKQSLAREIHRKEMQKQQYTIQESDNSLYGRAAVNIKSIMVGREEDGHEFALYVIEVRRQAGDQMPAAALLLIPAICRSRELRAFLSQSRITSSANRSQIDEKDFVTRIYNSVTDGMEEFLGNIPVLDQLSVAGQNLISAATAQMSGVPLNPNAPEFSSDPASAAEVEAEINAFEDREAEPFVKPICDIFLEIFELQKGTSWLRGRAVVVVLHQLLGGTIERKVRDAAKSFGQEDTIIRYLDLVKNIMWPDGQMKQGGVPRTAAQKAASQKEAVFAGSAWKSLNRVTTTNEANTNALSSNCVFIPTCIQSHTTQFITSISVGHLQTAYASMNPRAPHYRSRPSSSSASSGKDLESIYGSLHNSFVPASTPTMNGTREAPSPAMGNSTREVPTHSRSLVKFQPQKSSDNELLERARSQQLEQNQLAMHTKLLRLADQVNGLMAQRSAFEEEKAQSDKVIEELHREVDVLKAKVQEHHNKLDVCKRGIDDNAKEAQNMEQRIKAVPASLDSRFQHHSTRIDKVESLVRGAAIQIKQHTTQLSDGEKRIDQLEHKSSGNITTTAYHGSHLQQNGTISEVAQLKLNIAKVQQTQDSHQSYLEKTGETLITHQNNMATVSQTIDDLRSEFERLSTVNAGRRSDENLAPRGTHLRLDVTPDAIFRLQSQLDRLAEEVRHKNAESLKSDASSVANDVEILMIQMDDVRNKIRKLERDMGYQADMHRLLEQVSLSNKISLESMFYQLTKELEGRCAPEEIEFGLDEDRTFILRQRVLERLSVEDSVQCEFLRLKESQQMFA
ncbi:intermediate filament, regulator of G-protein signaling, partial [Aureobasidium melanogenum]